MIIKPNFKGNFTQISNELINHKGLSNNAKLLAIKLLSLPSSWKVNTKHLSEYLGVSVRTTQRIMKELIEFNILEKAQEMDEKNKKFTQHFTIIFKSESETEAELNEPLESRENKDIENETPINDGFKESENEQKPIKSNVETSDKTTPSGFVSHIYNKEFFSNKKFVYRLQNKNFILLFESAKVKKQKHDLSAFDEREQEKIDEWFKYKSKTKNKRLSFESKEMQLKKLRGFKMAKQNIITIINRSIENGWQGLFALKGFKNSEKQKSDRNVRQEEKEALMAYFDSLTKAN